MQRPFTDYGFTDVDDDLGADDRHDDDDDDNGLWEGEEYESRGERERK